MAMKLYENLMGKAFIITTGTGKPNIPIPDTPRIWLDESIGNMYSPWFKEVIILESEAVESEAVESEAVESEESVIDNEIDPINVEAIMAGAENFRIKKALDEYAAGFGVKLDVRKSMSVMRKTLRVELEKKNA